MKLKKTALFAEVISAIAIVLSLVILIFEVRANSELLKVSNRQEIGARISAMILVSASNPQFADTAIKLINGIELEEREVYQSQIYMGAVLKAIEEAYFQFQEGNLDEEIIRRHIRNIDTPFLREYLRLISDTGLFSENFYDWADEQIHFIDEF